MRNTLVLTLFMALAACAGNTPPARTAAGSTGVQHAPQAIRQSESGPGETAPANPSVETPPAVPPDMQPSSGWMGGPHGNDVVFLHTVPGQPKPDAVLIFSYAPKGPLTAAKHAAAFRDMMLERLTDSDIGEVTASPGGDLAWFPLSRKGESGDAARVARVMVADSRKAPDVVIIVQGSWQKGNAARFERDQGIILEGFRNNWEPTGAPLPEPPAARSAPPGDIPMRTPGSLAL
ncbi:MAG: hypothetical protein RLZZ324_1319 [Candidatus Parcubacteria bacterium]|jgi:hypothetical protein